MRVTTHTARPSTHRCRVIAQQAGTVERIILTKRATIPADTTPGDYYR